MSGPPPPPPSPPPPAAPPRAVRVVRAVRAVPAHPYAPPPSLSAEAPSALVPGRRGSGRFDVGLCNPLGVADAGPACCFAHVCCMPCLYTDALNAIESRQAGVVGGASFVGGLLSNSRNSVGGAAGSIGALLQVFAGITLRREVVEEYGLRESPAQSVAVACLCLPCSGVQVVNEVMRREVGPRGGAYRFGVVGLREGPYAPDAVAMARS